MQLSVSALLLNSSVVRARRERVMRGLRGSSALRAAWQRVRGVDDTTRGQALPCSPHVLSLARRMSALVPPGKSLGEVTHVELLEKEDADAIKVIWREYHEGKNGKIGFTVDPNAYARFRDRSTTCPMFVMPLHKSPSQFLTLVAQTKMPFASFTAIDDLRKLQEAATPMLAAAHYPELLESKKLALMQGTHVHAGIAGTAEHLTSQEATRLVRLCHLFYEDDALFEKFVKPFNHAQKKFDFDALVGEVAKRTWNDEIIQ